jgi:hypothetical protein
MTLCACGCGGTPKGPKSLYLPGHDSRRHGKAHQDSDLRQAMTIRRVGATKTEPLEFTSNRTSPGGIRAGMLVRGPIVDKEVQGKQYVLGGASGYGDPTIIEQAPGLGLLPTAQKQVLERLQ